MTGFLPQPVGQTALWQGVLEQLRRAILLGELAPDMHLREPELATRFGVSRLPVREAIGQLVRERLVRMEPRRVAFVIGLDEGDLSDVYEFRRELERYALRRAAKRMKTEDFVSLEAAVDRFVRDVEARQIELELRTDMAFHRLLVVMAGSRWLLEAWEPLAGLVGTMLAITGGVQRPHQPEGAMRHVALIDALRRGDVADADRILTAHFESAKGLMMDAMRVVREPRESALAPTVPVQSPG
ncbi:MAG: GntR family transcriptional regulator [Dehalococcoidales bacterium]|nr:GntR family transcriptional regulator [Dehalococcoidales bacterium]